jgi:glycogen synthase
MGGAEIALLNYIQALGMEHYDHYVYFFGHDGPLRKKIEALGVPVYFGPKRASIKRPIKFGLSVVLLVRNLLNFLKNKRIHFIQSRYEGLSIAMIEAMACGLPIIASDAPGLRNFVNHEENGLLFPVQDYKALAKHIRLLATDKRKKAGLSRSARQSFEVEYDMRRNIKLLDRLFRRICG